MEMNPTRNHEVAGSIPGLAQWVNNPSQTQLRSGVAVAVVWAGGCGSDWTPTPGTSIYYSVALKRTKDKKIKIKQKLWGWEFPSWHRGNESD